MDTLRILSDIGKGKCPVKLSSNRVWRTYLGGKLLEEWKGELNPNDGQFPEEWIASIVSARNPGREHIKGEGLSRIEVAQNRNITLKQLIDNDPSAFLGKKHVERYANNTGILIKALDSSERLTIQVHPDIETAKRLFGSNFGKTEAWYILSCREINGDKPYILFGFKPGVSREKWERLFQLQDTEGMINSLHKFYVKPGQIFLVESGIPHAIGAGCFLLEIQEPTDYTIRVERRTPAGRWLNDFLCHQGVGFEKMFDCFNYNTYSREEVLERWKLEPKTYDEADKSFEKTLISPKDTPCFSMNSLKIFDSVTLAGSKCFSIIVILSGEGIIGWNEGQMEIRQGEQIFLPYNVERVVINSTSCKALEIVRCFPPL